VVSSLAGFASMLGHGVRVFTAQAKVLFSLLSRVKTAKFGTAQTLIICTNTATACVQEWVVGVLLDASHFS